MSVSERECCCNMESDCWNVAVTWNRMIVMKADCCVVTAVICVSEDCFRSDPSAVGATVHGWLM